MTFWELQRQNVLRTVFLLAAYVLLFGAAGFAADFLYLGLPFPLLTPVALLLAASHALVGYFWGDRLILWSLWAELPDLNNPLHERAWNIVHEMALAAGLPAPQLFILPESSPNAFAAGRGPGHAVIAVTRGLLTTLNREELQAVIAHEMAHIRNRDILWMTMVSVLLGAIALLSDWAVRGWRFRFYGVREHRDPMPLLFGLVGFVFLLVAPLLAQLLALLVSRTREFLADAGAVEFTRNPLALARALLKASTHEDRIVDLATTGSAHLFFLNPLPRGWDLREDRWSSWWSTHPPVRKRIELLYQLARAPIPPEVQRQLRFLRS